MARWNCGSVRFFTVGLPLAGALAFSLGSASLLKAQEPGTQATAAVESSSLASGTGASGPSDGALPDAPLPVPVTDSAMGDFRAQSDTKALPVPARTHVTGPHDRLIDPTEIAPKLTSMDKVVMGFKGAVTPYSVVGWVGVSTYEQAFNRSPNYGQTGKGYAQRLGAAAARGTSEGIFTTSLYSPLFHTDPRYYILGPGYSFAGRTFHAISRVFVTKNDAGRETFDYALILGNLTGAAVTQTYYPAGNRNFDQVATTFGSSLAGSAFGYLFDEFIVNSAEFLQLKRKVDLTHGTSGAH